MKAYETELSKVKGEKAKLQDTQARQEDQCRKLHDKVETLAEKTRGLMLDNELKQRQVMSRLYSLYSSTHGISVATGEGVDNVTQQGISLRGVYLSYF